MGEARKKGSFEARKAKAISEGRVKVPAKNEFVRRISWGDSSFTTLAAMAMMARPNWRDRRIMESGLNNRVSIGR